MTPTIKRGLLRLAVILMILWNLAVFGFLYKSVYDNRYRDVSVALDRETSCLNNKEPYQVCIAQYENPLAATLNGVSLKRSSRPSLLRLLNCFHR